MKYIHKYHIDLSDSDKTNIFAFSDIHGDIDALISCLRDCAKVISTPPDWRTRAETTNPTRCLNELDQHGNRIGGFPIKDDFDCWDCRWIGGNSIVVITGDLIDNWRESISDNSTIEKRQHEMDYEEIKIMIFLKKMSIIAQKSGGNIINVLGNHDLSAISGSEYYSHYISKYSYNKRFINSKNKKISRIDFFRLNHDLFDNYIIEKDHYKTNDKCLIFRIENFLFMHAGLIGNLSSILKKSSTYDNNNDNNNYINGKIPELLKSDYDYIRHINIIFNKNFKIFISDLLENNEESMVKFIIENYVNNYLESNTILTERKYGTIYDNYSDMCNKYDEQLKILCPKSEYCKNTYLVIGHCVQPYDFIHKYTDKLANEENKYNPVIYTYSNTKKINQQSVQINGEIEELNYNTYNTKLNSDNPILSGITSVCPLESNNKFAKIYRIDVGVSRGFDMKYICDNLILNFKLDEIIDENKKMKAIKKMLYTLYSARAPQVLKIEYERNNLKNVKIVRSSLRNMFKTLRRNNSDCIVSNENGIITHARMITSTNDINVITMINQAIDEIDMLPKEEILQNDKKQITKLSANILNSNNQNQNQIGSAYDEYQYFKKIYLKLKSQK